jgi:hypothetical protein
MEPMIINFLMAALKKDNFRDDGIQVMIQK